MLTHIAQSAERISNTLIMTDTHGYSGNPNNFGDAQLQLDVETEQIIMDELKKSKVCKSASSEETPVKVDCSESTCSDSNNSKFYSVAFDPLDGSSIVDTNFAVGSI